MVQCGIIAVDVHPDHPHMLAAGLADGNVAVYNLQEKSQKPKYISTARNGKHQDIVWQVSSLNRLASSGPFGPLLARSGYPGQDASFYNNPMVMICATVNALTLL